MGRDWAKVLQSLPQDAVEEACIRYLRAHPKRSDKPTPGAIYVEAIKLVPRVTPTSKPDASMEARKAEPKLSKEETDAILADAGFLNASPPRLPPHKPFEAP